MATATIFPLNNTVKYIKNTDFYTTSISDISPRATISHTLPFRVKFKTINIEGFSSSNIPGIPLQVIGYSNYIL